MKIVFADDAWDDYQHWVNNDHKTLLRLNDLIEECRRSPFKGTGKPEPRRGELQGWWSRRINRELRDGLHGCGRQHTKWLDHHGVRPS